MRAGVCSRRHFAQALCLHRNHHYHLIKLVAERGENAYIRHFHWLAHCSSCRPIERSSGGVMKRGITSQRGILIKYIAVVAAHGDTSNISDRNREAVGFSRQKTVRPRRLVQRHILHNLFDFIRLMPITAWHVLRRIIVKFGPLVLPSVLLI